MTKFCGDCTYTDVVQVNMLNISTISSSQHRVEIYLLYLSLATNEWYTIKMWHQTKIRLFPCIIHVKHIHLCGWHWDMNDTWSHDVCDTVINGRVTQNTKGPKMLWLRTLFDGTIFLEWSAFCTNCRNEEIMERVLYISGVTFRNRDKVFSTCLVSVREWCQ